MFELAQDPKVLALAAGTVPANPVTKVLRSIIQFVAGLAGLLLVLIPTIQSSLPPSWTRVSAALATALVVAGVVTTVMANPAVNAFLTKYLPLLATHEVASSQVQSITSPDPGVAIAAAGSDTPTGTVVASTPVEPASSVTEPPVGPAVPGVA